jgi:two-component system cell cycle sensor histidine kinase/response regulator CckA
VKPALEIPLDGTEKILLVEDDQDVRILTATILKQQGYTVIEASNTGEACDALTAHKGTINLVLTDILMPSSGVPEMSHVLQATVDNVPVLYISGYTGDLLTRYGISGSEINFLEKPYTSQTLGRKIREVFAKEFHSRGRNAS